MAGRTGAGGERGPARPARRVALGAGAMWLFVGWACATGVRAQGPVDAPTDQVDWEVTVLRPAPDLLSLARRVAVQLHRRTGAEVRVGPPPPEVLEAVPAGSLAMAHEGGGIRLVLAGRAGRVAATELVLEGEGEADVRAVALAVESLQDQLGDQSARPPPPGATVRAGGTTWTILDPGAVTRAHGPARRTARPTFYTSIYAGVSALEAHPLLGPSLGGGLCGGVYCVVVEANAPLFAYTRYIQGDTIHYRAADLVARLQFRPLHFGDVILGGSVGLLSRIGRARVPVTGERRWESALGVRLTAEGIYRFAAPLECVYEMGLDVIADPAQFIRGTPVPPPVSVTLDRTVGLWMTLALRIRI